MILWDYAIERRVSIHSTVRRPCFQGQGKTHHEFTFGNQSNISNICNFGSHEWVYHRDYGSFPENKEKLGRLFRTCKDEGNEMSQSIVSSSGCAITRRTVQSLRTSELHSEPE